MRAAIYIRWSTEDQGDGTTLAVQREACEAYVRSQGWAFAPELIFVDDGCSGGSLQRPALARLRRLVAAGGVDCVVVCKLDRLSRSVVDTVNLVLREWEGRCHLKSAREPIDTASAMGKQFFYLLVSYAEWERNTIRERTLSGKLRRAREGRNPGFTPPYGLRRGATPGAFEPVPDETLVVRRIFEQFLAGESVRGIARLLAAEGVRGRQGRLFSEGSVRAVLSNRLYAGEMAYGRGAAAVVAPVAGLAPLVDPARFAAAAARRRAAAATPPRSVNSSHLLSGVLHCRCGAAMIAATKGRRGEANYYVCGAQKRAGTAACAAGYLRRDWIEALVAGRLAARFGGVAAQGRYRAEAQAALAAHRTQAEQSLRQAEARLQALARRRQGLRQDYLREALTAADYRELRAALDAEAAQLQTQAELAAQRLATTGAALRAAGSAAATLSEGQRWHALDPAQRRQVLRSLLPGVVAWKAAGEISVELTWATDAAASS